MNKKHKNRPIPVDYIKFLDGMNVSYYDDSLIHLESKSQKCVHAREFDYIVEQEGEIMSNSVVRDKMVHAHRYMEDS